MSDRLTDQSYWAEVRSIVESIETEIRAEHPGEDADAMSEAAHERLWETIDGHQWVIYTHYNYQVLSISPNDGYSLENFGSDGIVSDGVLDTAKLAFGALYADCMALLADVEWEQSEEEVA